MYCHNILRYLHYREQIAYLRPSLTFPIHILQTGYQASYLGDLLEGVGRTDKYSALRSFLHSAQLGSAFVSLDSG